MTGLGRAVVGFLGALAVGLALAVALVPDLVLGVPGAEAAVAVLGEVDPTGVMLVVGLVAGVGTVVVARRAGGRTTLRGPAEGTGSDAMDRFDAAPTGPTERATGVALVGADDDERVAAAVRGDDEAMAALRDALRERAVVAVATARGVDRATAAAMVDRGEWTRDPVAAAFLAPDDPARVGGSVASIRRWLAPARTRRRRFHRTLDALEAVAEVDG